MFFWRGERDCVFITPDKSGKAIWYITRHEPEKWFVEMLKILPGVTACRLNIQLSETAIMFCGCTLGHQLGAVGDEFVHIHCRLLPKVHAGLGKRANYFLKTGCRLWEHRVTSAARNLDEATEDDGTWIGFVCYLIRPKESYCSDHSNPDDANYFLTSPRYGVGQKPRATTPRRDRWST